MRVLLAIAAICTLSVLEEALGGSVTYGDLGEFTYGVGAPICHHDRPESPEAIVIRYWLYTESNPETEQLIDRTSSSSIRGSNFDSRCDTKLIIHGYTDDYRSGWAQAMKDGLLTKDANVIMVDWEEGAGRINYAQSRANTRVVGRDIGKLIEKLRSVTGVSYSSFHIIGHSLGAHTAGYAGEARSGIGRLTGLDPAGPEFTTYGAECRLDESDATFVDAIHTDGEVVGAGCLDKCGHQDFYPNGGEEQPGCEGTSVLEACDHMRAVHLFTESITTSCKFAPTKKCSTWSSNYSSCPNCGGTCPEMGYNAQKSKGQGAYYIATNGGPYCK